MGSLEVQSITVKIAERECNEPKTTALPIAKFTKISPSSVDQSEGSISQAFYYYDLEGFTAPGSH